MLSKRCPDRTTLPSRGDHLKIGINRHVCIQVPRVRYAFRPYRLFLPRLARRRSRRRDGSFRHLTSERQMNGPEFERGATLLASAPLERAHPKAFRPNLPGVAFA